MKSKDVNTLAKDLMSGSRRSLAKAVTLVESSNISDELLSEELLKELMPHTGKSLRIGVSGPPGAGKSSFIEKFGIHLIGTGHRLAVLAIDPSSPVSGGSIMGDKTRMEQLAVSDAAFVRPSPSGLVHGGVARHTRESILLCEAAGYDIVMVETVGVGQSDVVVASMVDCFILLQAPHGGDELQGIKRGVLELADIVCITKADGETKMAATRAKGELERALMMAYGRRPWDTRVITISSVDGSGFDDVQKALNDHRAHNLKNGEAEARRSRQAKSWFEDEIIEIIRNHLKHDPALDTEFARIQEDVHNLKIPASAAARQFVDKLLGKSKTETK